MLWPGQAGCGRRRSAVSTRFEHCCSLAGRVSSGIAPARQVLYPAYACQREQQQHRVLCHRGGGVAARVAYRDAMARGGREIDVVGARGHHDDQAQAPRASQRICGQRHLVAEHHLGIADPRRDLRGGRRLVAHPGTGKRQDGAEVHVLAQARRVQNHAPHRRCPAASTPAARADGSAAPRIAVPPPCHGEVAEVCRGELFVQ